jgi:hypothetical protein
MSTAVEGDTIEMNVPNCLSLAVVTDAPVLMVTRHGWSPNQPWVFRLLSLLLAKMLSVNGGASDTGGHLLPLASIHFLSLSHPLCWVHGGSYFRSDRCPTLPACKVASPHDGQLGWAGSSKLVWRFHVLTVVSCPLSVYIEFFVNALAPLVNRCQNTLCLINNGLLKRRADGSYCCLHFFLDGACGGVHLGVHSLAIVPHTFLSGPYCDFHLLASFQLFLAGLNFSSFVLSQFLLRFSSLPDWPFSTNQEVTVYLKTYQKTVKLQCSWLFIYLSNKYIYWMDAPEDNI